MFVKFCLLFSLFVCSSFGYLICANKPIDILSSKKKVKNFN